MKKIYFTHNGKPTPKENATASLRTWQIQRKSPKREIPTDVEILQEICIPQNSKEGNLTDIEYFESRNDFQILIKKLKEDEKTLVTLHYEIGYTTKQISKILNIKEGTIKSKISRVKKKLDEIKKKGGEI